MPDERHGRTDVEQLQDQVTELFVQFRQEQLTADSADPAGTARRRLRAAADIRRAWRAVEPDLSAAIAFVGADGLLSAAEVAGELDVSVSYVQEVLREFMLFSWRVDVLDGPPGPGWQTWSYGQGITGRPDAALAEYGDEQLADATRKRTEALRVLVWEGHDTADEDAVHRAQRPAR